MTKKQKLELTWIGKENRPKLEPRILLEDLDKERKAIMKQWAKREEQIERVMGATVGMYEDLQGIAGKTLQEIEGLSFPALEDRTAPL